MDLLLDIPAAQQDAAWKQSQDFPASSRLQSYINKLCLEIVLPWMEQVTASKASDCFDCWELVNGTAITIDKTRFVLIPSQTVDTTEICVPIEWVDIPNWAADYYLAIQVNPEDSWVRIWGYTTHLQLKIQGTYNHRDRTYSLDSNDLIHDINVLWVSRELCPEAATRGEIEPFPTLSMNQAIDLISRLANPAVAFPRRAVPFSIWGALLESNEYRQRLIESRQQR